MIVPVRDAEATLERALSSVAAQRLDGDYEVIVVDDGSRDSSPEIAARAPGPVTLIRQEALGPSAARNRGAAAARGEVLAFTDADCFAEPGWLEAALRAIGSADLVQGVVSRDSPARPLPFDRTIEVARQTPLFESANLVVRRDLFERLGGFEQWIEPEVGKSFGEDLWLGWRARRAGARIAFAPDAVVRHAVFGQSLGEYLDWHRRLRYFPAACAQVPELRDEFFFARVFLSRHTAKADLAAAGCAAALVSRSRAPLLAVLPYAIDLAREAAPWQSRAPQALAGGLLRDLVGLCSLVLGSARYRTLVV